MTDDDKKLLEAGARFCDQVAKEHEGHDPNACETTSILRTVSASIRQTLATSRGPAQVATEAYRENWDKLFGGKHDRSVN